MQNIYLDYNASTPIDPDVLREMLPYLMERYGNPSSAHAFGVPLRAAIERARAQVADLIGCSPSEIIFTSGATESNNMVIKGLAKSSGKGSHFITSSIEHPSVMEPCRRLEQYRYDVTYLPVDRFCMIDPADLEKAITPKTALVTIMHANNEVGTLQNIAELASIAAKSNIPFHTDAAQSVGKTPVKVNEMNVQFLTMAGHKFYGPKGIGALYVRDGAKLQPLLHGAGHERGMRPGTENVASIVGLGAAAQLAGQVMARENVRLVRLGQRLLDGLKQAGLNATLHGHPERKLPNTWNISCDGLSAAEIMAAMPTVAVSPGAACHGDSVAPSHVLTAMGVAPGQAAGAIRYSLGRETTEDEIDEVVLTVKRMAQKREKS